MTTNHKNNMKDKVPPGSGLLSPGGPHGGGPHTAVSDTEIDVRSKRGSQKGGFSIYSGEGGVGGWSGTSESGVKKRPSKITTRNHQHDGLDCHQAQADWHAELESPHGQQPRTEPRWGWDIDDSRQTASRGSMGRSR